MLKAQTLVITIFFFLSGISVYAQNTASCKKQFERMAKISKCNRSFVEIICSDSYESYMGVNLYGLKNLEVQKQIKKYMNMLPKEVASSLKNISLIDSKFHEQCYKNAPANFSYVFGMGLSKKFFGTKDMIIQNKKTFFHEAGHAQIFSRKLNFGGMEDKDPKKKLWANISGIDNYLKGCDKKPLPEKTRLKRGFLSHHASKLPDEDLADWTGYTYKLYLEQKDFSEYLKKGLDKEIFIKKINFLREHNFISKLVYDKILAN